MGPLPKSAALATMMLCSGAAKAQDPPPQPIELSANDAFTHEHSKVRLPPVLTGLRRFKAMENEPGQLHISLQYASPDSGESFIVILYRDVGGGLPVWFDRARRRAERGEIGTATLHAAGEFVPPGRTNASGLLATYALAGKGYRSTGVAIVPAGGWLVTLWAASGTRSPVELDARIKAALAEIVWPKMDPAPDVIPVAACTSALALSGAAKPLPKTPNNVSETLMVAMKEAMAIKQSPKEEAKLPQPKWCRDPIELDNAGVYRADEQTDGYFLAVSDSGRGGHVRRRPEPLPRSGKKGRAGPTRYEVRSVQMSLISASVPLDRLPPPAQALPIVSKGPFLFSVYTWGERKGSIGYHDDSLKILL